MLGVGRRGCEADGILQCLHRGSSSHPYDSQSGNAAGASAAIISAAKTVGVSAVRPMRGNYFPAVLIRFEGALQHACSARAESYRTIRPRTRPLLPCCPSSASSYNQHVVTRAKRAMATLALLALSLTNAAVAAATETQPAPAPNYRVHPGDQLAISVLGEQALTQTVTVAPDGTVAYPLVGKVGVGGKTVAEVTATLQSGLHTYLRDPAVTVAVVAVGADNVLVLGDVKTPGKYSLPGTSRLTDAIAAAGGLGETNGTYPTARVSLDGGAPVDVSLDKLLVSGDVSLNMLLSSDAVVYVKGPLPLVVQVLGAVDHPGDVQVNDGDRLSMALAKAGNSTNSYADLSNVHVTRVLPNGSTSTISYDLYRELRHGDLTADPVLHKGDVVYVPQAKKTDRTSALQTLFLLFSRIAL
ncbi:hypothetical protein EPN52_00230 [bacterium]|nr:MAG: hypothetical protein EPN52_00230 [bacterium]